MNKDFLIKVSNELKIIRIEHNDLQEDLARKSGVATSTICAYESGLSNMKMAKLGQILKAYDITLDIFFTRILAKTQVDEGK